MQRFFVTFPLSMEMNIQDSDIYHQLTRVLRIQLWDHITLFSWDNREIEYEIVSIDKKQISIRWIQEKFPDIEPKKHIILYQALPNKYEKIEYIIQKWVEIGISRFVFFRSDRSQKLVLTPAKKERFDSIAREALEQCGWLKMPQITWEEGIPQDVSESENIVLDTIGENKKISSYDAMENISLWVGPEGGWSEVERSNMLKNGFIFARFGNRVLRTETAWIVISFGFING
jgi:16S rRNA (uracil1498-N3)-methyltransferase